MASGGPTNKELYQQIFNTKDPVKKQEMMKALSGAQKREYMQYLQLTKSSAKIARLESTLVSLDEREAALKSEDKTYLTQASTSYAPKVGEVQTSVPKELATGSAPRYGSKFNQ